MINQLRIHISVLGYIADRIYVPVLDMKADKLYLLRKGKETDERAQKALKIIRKELRKAKNIDFIEETCEIFEPTEVVKKTKEIMLRESQHHFYLNISSGNTLSSNALTIASMLNKNKVHSVKLYYYEYDYTNMKIKDSEVINLPAFQIHSPSKEQQQVLKFISKKLDGMRKKEILCHLHEGYTSLKRDKKSQLIMNLNRRVIDKLLFEWKMIEITGKGKTAIINLNDEGKEFIKFIE